MNTEEKAKAYYEALERAKDCLTDRKFSETEDTIRSFVEYIFPELAESENERIRKALIDGVRQIRCKNGITQEQMLDWLKKQKEQKSIKMEVYEVGKGTTVCGQDYKCKKDYKEGNCWYIKDVLYHCSRDGYLTDQNGVSWSCTPEWFNEYIQSNTEWAEEEKTRFVSGQFLECKLSFDEFKEGEHYWLEYIGDDMYVGRSDNILNQKFHITPRQLYTLFSQQLEENEKEQDKCPEYCVRSHCIGCSIYEKQKEQKPKDITLSREDCLHQLFENGTITMADYLYLTTNRREQKPVPINPDDKHMLERIMELVEFCDDKETIWNWLCEKIKAAEQKPAEWSEKHIADIFEKVGLAKIAREQGNDELTNALQDAVLELSKVGNAEWSEVDKHYLNSVIRLVHGTNDGAWGSCIGDRIENWLKSLPERFNLQSKEKWSEEDEKMRNLIIETLDDNSHYFPFKETKMKMIDWFKSLCPRSK